MSFDDEYWKKNKGGIQQQHIQAFKLIENEKNLKLLDVGCGDGTFLQMLPEKWKTVGIEKSQTAWYKCIKKGLNVYQGDILDGIDRKYDIITLLDVLEHTLEPEKMLKIVRKNADYIILTVPNMAFIKDRIYALLGLIPSELREKKGHCQYITEKRIKQIIRDSGYEIINENHYYASGLPKCLPALFATMFCYKIKKVKVSKYCSKHGAEFEPACFECEMKR